MIDKKSFLFISLLSLSTSSTFGSIRTQYRTVTKDLSNLKRRISYLETKITKKNNDYLSAVKKRQLVDLEIYEIRNQISLSISNLENKKKDIDKKLKILLLNNFDFDGASDLLEHKLVLNKITKSKREVDLQLKRQRELQTKVRKLTNDFQERIKVERDLLELVKNLEQSKKDYVENYLDKKDRAKKLRKSLKKIALNKSKRKKKVVKKKVKVVKNTLVGVSFDSPLDNYQSYEVKNNKGVTFVMNANSKVLAAKSGKVSYTGPLSNYGNLVMVDHGNGVRTLYLGDISIGVKKGQDLKAGDVIGLSKRSVKKSNASELYFEVRNKDKAQNTVKLVKNLVEKV